MVSELCFDFLREFQIYKIFKYDFNFNRAVRINMSEVRLQKSVSVIRKRFVFSIMQKVLIYTAENFEF